MSDYGVSRIDFGDALPPVVKLAQSDALQLAPLTKPHLTIRLAAKSTAPHLKSFCTDHEKRLRIKMLSLSYIKVEVEGGKYQTLF